MRLSRPGKPLAPSALRDRRHPFKILHFLEFSNTKLYEARGGRVRLTAAGERTLDLAVAALDQLAALARVVAAEVWPMRNGREALEGVAVEAGADQR